MRQKIQIAGGAAASLLAALLFMSVAPGALRAQQNPSPDAGKFLFSGGQGAFLGVTLKDVTAEQVRTMKLPGEYGAIVAHVEPNSPAAKAGLEVNDVILEFGGMQVWSAAQLGRLVRETPPGRTVTLRVSRAGEKLTLEADLTARKELFSHMVTPRIHISPNTFNFSFMPARYRLGVHIEPLTSQLAGYFGVKEGKGALVTQVEPDSPASKAGLKAGDCIVKAGSTEIASTSGLVNALNDAKDFEITLSIVRAGHEQNLTAKLEPAPNPMPNRRFERQLERQSQAIRRQLPRLEQMQRQWSRFSTGEV